MIPPFTPDARNLGGRNMISQQIWNHLQQLKEISQQIPQILISPRKLPNSPKQSIEPINYKRVNRKQDYLLYPTYLFRRKTISESFTSLSPKNIRDETQLLFQEPLLRRQKNLKSPQKIFPFSTIQLGTLYKIKANEIKMNKKNDQIPWYQVEMTVKDFNIQYEDLLNEIQQVILDFGIYSASDYQILIHMILRLKPQIPKMDLLNIFNELIIKQQLQLS
ncbi:unnamed protein product [Paramecium pentaurelia]|uniref:Uncharacterized protein n=1 Tax=Paramecium pentaurelia TaxID=43138 RepID=A0A8S1X3X9_9CILI|nr:unnamed protein product [Paramecium pentaurelia]